MVSAFCRRDLPALREVASRNLTGPLRDVARVLTDALDGLLRDERSAVYPDDIDEVLAQNLPPDLAVCLLYTVWHRSWAENNLTESERLLNMMKERLAGIDSREGRIIVHRTDYRQAWALGDLKRQLETASSGFELGGDEDVTTEFAAGGLAAALWLLDLPAAERFARVVEQHRDGVTHAFGTPADVLLAHHDRLTGHLERAAERLHEYAGEPDLVQRMVKGCAFVRTLLCMEQTLKARQELDAMRAMLEQTGTDLQPDQVTRLRRHLYLEYAVCHLARHEIEDTRVMLQIVENHDPCAGFQQTRLFPLVCTVDLCAGNIAKVRRALQRIDPKAEQPPLQGLWLRLAALEGNDSLAARHLGAILGAGQSAVAEELLRYAYELTPSRLARLWFMATRTPAPAPAQKVPAPYAAAQPELPVLVGSSAVMRRVRSQIDAFAAADQNVLIVGETGTGKDIAARLIHLQGVRRDLPFITLNCAAIPDSLAEAELFGHTRGAFTGANQASQGLIGAAGKGTVFLDEINSLSMHLQGILLRVLETGEYRPVGSQTALHSQARFILASNEDLEQAVTENRFRADLFYRLNRFCIVMPPLRDHTQDIPELCDQFIRHFTGGNQTRPSRELLDLFRHYDWPGNVRQLRNEIERLAFLYGSQPEIPVENPLQKKPDRTRPASPGTPAPRRREVSPERASAPDVGTIPGSPKSRERRLRILALLDELPHLYRADIIQRIGCSPVTATEDLRVLEELGALRRVITSGHLRTSYFVRAHSTEHSQS